MQLKTLTVTEVNSYLKKTLDNDFILNNLSIKGEISNFKLHSSGNMYFTLKDEDSKINCIMFKNNAVNLNFIPENGMKVEIKAKLSIYIKEGNYQLYCKEVKKIGIGELFEEFIALKSRLEQEGIFDSEYKREIPKYPKRVGVVTSPTGAAIRDIITVIQRRNEYLDIVLYPALVQGNGACESIIDGIRYFNACRTVDVIIVGRGGGSIEELWAFNNMELAYEIFNSKIPIVSAVGHETDYTICDFVSDVRAATPSAAAELVSPSSKRVLEEYNYYNKYLNSYIANLFLVERNRLDFLSKIIMAKRPDKLINERLVQLNYLESKLYDLITYKLDKEKSKISGLNHILMTLNPLNILGRGYCLIKDTDNNIISHIQELKNKDEINIIMQDGNMGVDISLKE